MSGRFRSIAILGLGLAVMLPGFARADEPPPNPSPGPLRSRPAAPRSTTSPSRSSPSTRGPRTTRRRSTRSASTQQPALQDRRILSDAITLLEEALAKDPTSVAIPRRLSPLCFALGKTDQAVDYARKVVEADPGDARTLRDLAAHYRRKNDLDAAEAVLKGALNHKDLDKASSSYLIVVHDLGLLLADRDQYDKAAGPGIPVDALTTRRPTTSRRASGSRSSATRPSRTRSSARCSTTPGSTTWPSSPSAAPWCTTPTAPRSPWS